MRYPTAIDPRKVGKYPAAAYAGGGYVWDEVLEYRVWCHPERGAPDLAEGSDYFFAFATHPKALAFARKTRGAEQPLVLIRQREYIDEPEPGRYVHVKRRRVTEWPAEFLRRPRRTASTIPDFLAPDAPSNRLRILRGKEASSSQCLTAGVSQQPGRMRRAAARSPLSAAQPAWFSTEGFLRIRMVAITRGRY